jgi:hypothetical protein
MRFRSEVDSGPCCERPGHVEQRRAGAAAQSPAGVYQFRLRWHRQDDAAWSSLHDTGAQEFRELHVGETRFR